jgi:hypothetical protein
VHDIIVTRTLDQEQKHDIGHAGSGNYMIKLSDLQEYSEEEKRNMHIPAGATSRGGRWYVGNTYAGKVVNGKFIAVNKSQPNAKPQQKSTNTAKLPQFDKFQADAAGAGRDVTKKDWQSYVDKVVVSAYEKQNPPIKMPNSISKNERENAKQDFNKQLTAFSKGSGGLPPRTTQGNIEPKFLNAMINHQKQFPYSTEIWNKFGGASGEQPDWMPRIYK